MTKLNDLADRYVDGRTIEWRQAMMRATGWIKQATICRRMLKAAFKAGYEAGRQKERPPERGAERG